MHILEYEKSNNHEPVDNGYCHESSFVFTAYFITLLCVNDTRLLHEISWQIPYTFHA